MSKLWQAYAQHIIDNIAKIERIKQRGNIADDEVLYDAVLRNLQTLSEATQKIPSELKELHSNIPWAEISAFRNILVHNYLGDIDPKTIDNVVQSHLQPLKYSIQNMLKNN